MQYTIEVPMEVPKDKYKGNSIIVRVSGLVERDGLITHQLEETQ